MRLDRMLGSLNTNAVPKPSTVNGAIRLIAAMAVANAPTSEAENIRALRTLVLGSVVAETARTLTWTPYSSRGEALSDYR